MRQIYCLCPGLVLVFWGEGGGVHGHDCYSRKPSVSWTVSRFTLACPWSHLEAVTALSECDMDGFRSKTEIQKRGDGKEQLAQHSLVWANITMVTATWESSLYVGRRDIRKEHAVPYNIGVKHSWLQRKMWLLMPLLVGWSCLSFMQKLLGNWKRGARRVQLLEWVISAGQNESCHLMLGLSWYLITPCAAQTDTPFPLGWVLSKCQHRDIQWENSGNHKVITVLFIHN